MKKIFSILVAVLMASTMSVNAAERGKFIHVDNSSSKNLKPQMAFCVEHKDGKDVTTLLVKTVDVNAYKEFTDASRILVRFADGKAVRLNRVADVDIIKNKFSKKNGWMCCNHNMFAKLAVEEDFERVKKKKSVLL